ncbi:MAG: glutamate 5-kinase, partial [Pirellulales bacterium]
MTDLLRQEIATSADTIVVKVGTRVLARPDGKLDDSRVATLAEEMHQVIESGRRIALVSSGAVAAGMGVLGL